jgi:monoamine oxidase
MTTAAPSRRRALAWAAAASFARPFRLRAAVGADVLILGAGLSGLHAAHLMESQGVKVAILDARRRVGGRVHTLDDVPGKPEAGGNAIGLSYARVLDTVERLGLKLGPMRFRSDPGILPTTIHVGGRMIAESEWASAAQNPFPDAARAKKPWEFQVPYFLNDNPLTDIESWRDPKFSAYDISLYQAAKAKGLSDAAIDLGFDKAGLYGTNSFDVSMLGMYQIFKLAGYVVQQFGTQQFAIVGGNQRLPEALAGSLKSDIHLGRIVVGVRADSAGVEAVCADGMVFRGRRIIVTAPFPALRGVVFDPVLPGLQAEAISQLGYSVGHQIHFAVTRRFWEDDGLPITIWSDGIIGRLAPLYYDAEQKNPTTIIAFVNGARAVWLDRMSEADATAHVLAVLKAIRPATAGALRPLKVQSWQRDPFAGGLYSSWKPGQIVRYAAAMAQPFGPIHFAGEHTAAINRGMEGAMESGERAALEAMAAL